MGYRLAIEAVVVAHFLFILFVIFGAVVAWKYPLLRWLHWASMAYGLLIEIFHWVCPLTLVETELRRRGGLSYYDDSFISHYLQQIIYLDAPRRSLIIAAVVVVSVNIGLYWLFSRRDLIPNQARKHEYEPPPSA